MEITPTEVLIGAAAAAALFCDYLRRRATGPAAKPAARRASLPQSVNAPVPPAPQPVEQSEPALPTIREQMAEVPAARPPKPLPKFLPESPEMNPRKALADWLDQRAEARASQKRAPVPPALPPRYPESPQPEMLAAPEGAVLDAEPATAPLITELPEPSEVRSGASAAFSGEEIAGEREQIRTILRRALDRRSAFESPLQDEETAVEDAAPAGEQAAPAPVAARSVEIDADVVNMLEADAPAASRSFADLWNAMAAPTLAAKPKPRPAASAAPKFHVIHGMPVITETGEASLPAGMYDLSVLNRVIAGGGRFSGFVLSVGVCDNEGRALEDRDLLRSVGIFIGSLLAENEFACARGNDEFLIVCPGHYGAEAQLRLTAVSEQLWDYQLRNAQRFSLVFTWGSAEARGESLAETVAEAGERMREARRTRRLVSVDLLRSQPRAAAI